jgi:hypothetical protein
MWYKLYSAILDLKKVVVSACFNLTIYIAYLLLFPCICIAVDNMGMQVIVRKGLLLSKG